MANTTVLKDAFIQITDGTLKDISDYVSSITIDSSLDDLDDTTFGSGAKTHAAGLEDGSVSLELVDSFANGEIDDIAWNIFKAGVNVEMRVRPNSGAISTSNKEYRFQICPVQYGVGGAVGELATKSLSYPISGGVTRVSS